MFFVKNKLIHAQIQKEIEISLRPILDNLHIDAASFLASLPLVRPASLRLILSVFFFMGIGQDQFHLLPLRMIPFPSDSRLQVEIRYRINIWLKVYMDTLSLLVLLKMEVGGIFDLFGLGQQLNRGKLDELLDFWKWYDRVLYLAITDLVLDLT